jgi:hypothetical protein
MRAAWLTLIITLAAATGAAAQNIFPDPSFETWGEAGQARTGEKAGHLAITEPTHWIAIEGELEVEPYATYRATGWVKGTVDQGAAQALYAYEWDSYVWAFSAPVSLVPTEEWAQVTTTIRSPDPTIRFHALAFTDVNRADFWIDDVVVEQVLSPEETIAQIEAQEALSDDDVRLLARYYVEHGRMEDARRLLESDLPRTIASDVACVTAKATEDPADRASLLATMIRTGAAEYHGGLERISEVSDGLPPEEMGRALAAEIGETETAAEVTSITQAVMVLGAMGPALTIEDRLSYLEMLGAATAARLQAAEEGSEVAAALTALEREIALMTEGLSALAEDLGTCAITIDGHPVTPETYAIVLPRDATPSEGHAAKELQVHLERITGQILPIVPLRDALTKKRFMISSRELSASVGAEAPAGLGDEGLRIRTVDGNVLFDGGKRGILYAVYTFLEDYLDCRWFTVDCMTWPTEGRYDLGGIDLTYLPPLEYRATDYPKSRPPEFAVRNKLNGHLVQATEEWGEHITYRGFVHTFNALVPPSKYFAEHPEYFSMVGGERIRERTQLCLTNPEVLRVAIDTVREWIKESPDATIISVSQNDWHNYCECDSCTALAEAEGSQSGPMVHFVNAIAEDIAEDYPHIIIDTLAYLYTRQPPEHVVPRENVAIRLCSIECEFNRPLAESEYNASFVEDIRGWNEICDRLHIWDYVINYRHCVQPFPNLRVLKPNIRFFIDNGVKGIYEEANYFSRGGEMGELRTYLIAKLLWDPSYDVEAGIDEFLAAYYGPAAEPIGAYLNDIHDLAVSDPDFHMTIFHEPIAPFQEPDAIARYVELFDRAEELVADDPVRLHRVRVARQPIIYTQLVKGAEPGYQLTEEALVPSAGGRQAKLIEKFMATAAAEGQTAVAEWSSGRDLETWAAQYRASAEAHPVVRLTGGGLSAVVVPSLGGRILSLVRQSDGRELLQIGAAPAGIDPTVGGYEEYSTADYRSPGWIEPYQVAAQGPGSVILSAQLDNGLLLERRYELDQAQPILRITSTLTNITEAPITAGLRIHPAFRLDEPADAYLRVGPEGEGATTHPLAGQAEEMIEIRLEGEALPPGEWALVDPASGTTIACRFLPDQVQACYFNGYGADNRANLELFAPTVELAPGQSQTVQQIYHVGP